MNRPTRSQLIGYMASLYTSYEVRLLSMSSAEDVLVDGNVNTAATYCRISDVTPKTINTHHHKSTTEIKIASTLSHQSTQWRPALDCDSLPLFGIQIS